MSKLLSHNQVILVFNPRPRQKALLRHKMQTLMTQNFVLCWLFHDTYRNEKQVRNDRKFITLKESLMSSSSQGLKSVGTRELVALFSRQSRLNQDTFSERERPVDILGSNESISRFSNRQMCGNRDHLLAQARSELMKREHKVESLDKCNNEASQCLAIGIAGRPSRIH